MWRCTAFPRCSPPAARAAVLTLATTVEPIANECRGVRTRTVSPSAQYVLPDTALPFTVTENAAAVDFSSIGHR